MYKRQVIREYKMPNTVLETFLRESIVERFSLTILLRRNHRNIKASSLPERIFKRNNKLRGGLRTVKVKKYADTDKNANGTSRKQWRLIHLVADETFLESLAKFPKDHRFCLGADGITINGGVRTGAGPHQKKGSRPIFNNKIISQVVESASDEVFDQEESRERDIYGKNKKKE